MVWKSGQSYSADLPSRVLAAVDGGTPARAVAERFQVSVSYIYKALGRRTATGETEARPQRNHQELKLAATPWVASSQARSSFRVTSGRRATSAAMAS